MELLQKNKKSFLELILLTAIITFENIYYLPTYNIIDNKENIIEQSKYMLTQEKLNTISKKIKQETKIINVIIDSGYHAVVVKKIADTKLHSLSKKLQVSIENIFIPKFMNSDYINNYSKILAANNIETKYFLGEQRAQLAAYRALKSKARDYEILETFALNHPMKNLYFNMSYSRTLSIEMGGEYNKKIFQNNFIHKYLKYINDENIKLLNVINKHPNIFLYKAAGNNFVLNSFSNNQIIDELLPHYIKYSIGDYDKMVRLSTIFYNFIESMLKNIPDARKTIHRELNLENIYLTDNRLNTLIDLHMVEYFYMYETTNLLKHLNTNYKQLASRVKIVEAFSNQSLKRNYKLLKKYNYKIVDKELYDYVNGITVYTRFNEYDQDEIEELKKLSNKYSDKYPELFKITEYGTFVDLQLKNTRSLIIGPTYHNVEYQKVGGTSLTTPDLMTDKSLSFAK